MTTPVTKRIGMVCLTFIAIATIGGVVVGKIEIGDALIIVMAVVTSVSALIDGGA